MVGIFISTRKSEYQQQPPVNLERGISFPYEFIDCNERERNISENFAANTYFERFNILSINKSDILLANKSDSDWNSISQTEKRNLLSSLLREFTAEYELDSSYVFIVSCDQSGYRWVGYGEYKNSSELIRFDW